MPLMPIMVMAVAAILAIGMAALAFTGPSPQRALNRRLSAVRGRHGASTAVVEAQMRKITAGRATRMDEAAARLLPKPALLKKRLAMTGKPWTVGQYGMASGGIIVIVGLLLWFQGLPIVLALLVGVMLGAGLPHFVVGFLIKRRITQFNSKFPDAIELLVRGLRSGLPIAETMAVVGHEVQGPVGVEFR